MRVPGARIVEKATRQDQAEAELAGLHRERRRLDLRAARLLASIDGSYHYAYRGCGSLAEYGEVLGLSGREARMLAAVGRSLDLQPGLEERILDGKLSMDAAAALGRVFENPALVRDGDDWLRWAEEWSARALERAVRQRLVEAEEGEAVSALHAQLTSRGRERFERARQLACRKENKLLTEGQTVEVLSDHYLDSFDPARREPRKRRTPDTSGRSGRYVPEEVKRRVIARQGDRCAVPGCDHELWLEKAHVLPHRRGGSREAGNLVYLCRQHHILFDHGFLEIAGTADDPVFEAARAPP